MFQRGKPAGLLALRSRFELQQTLTVEIFIDIKGAADALEAVIGDDKQAVFRLQLLHDQSQSVIEHAIIFRRFRVWLDNLIPERMLQAVGADEDDVAEIPGFLRQQVLQQRNALPGHLQRGIDELLHAVLYFAAEDIAQVNVNFVIRHDAEKLLLERGRISEFDRRAGGQIAADHDAVDGFGRVGDGNVDDQHLLAVLAQDIPDGLAAAPVRLHKGSAPADVFRAFFIGPEIVNAMPGGFEAGRK